MKHGARKREGFILSCSEQLCVPNGEKQQFPFAQFFYTLCCSVYCTTAMMMMMTMFQAIKIIEFLSPRSHMCTVVSYLPYLPLSQSSSSTAQIPVLAKLARGAIHKRM